MMLRLLSREEINKYVTKHSEGIRSVVAIITDAAHLQEELEQASRHLLFYVDGTVGLPFIRLPIDLAKLALNVCSVIVAEPVTAGPIQSGPAIRTWKNEPIGTRLIRSLSGDVSQLIFAPLCKQRGEALKEARRARDLTARQVGEIMGVPALAIYSIEDGATSCDDAEYLARLEPFPVYLPTTKAPINIEEDEDDPKPGIQFV